MKPNSHVIKWMTFRYMTYWHSYWLNNRVFFFFLSCSIKFGYSLLHNLTLAKIQTVVWMLIGFCPFCVHRVFITYTLALMSLHSILRLKLDLFLFPLDLVPEKKSLWSCNSIALPSLSFTIKSRAGRFMRMRWRRAFLFDNYPLTPPI